MTQSSDLERENRTLRAVEVAALGIGLELAVPGQHVFVRPLITAEFDPGVEATPFDSV